MCSHCYVVMKSLIDFGHLDNGFLVLLMPWTVLKIVLMLQSFRINNQPLDNQPLVVQNYQNTVLTCKSIGYFTTFVDPHSSSLQSSGVARRSLGHLLPHYFEVNSNKLRPFCMKCVSFEMLL